MARRAGDAGDAPALHTLTLDLGTNDIGDSGAEAFPALQYALALRNLNLDLQTNAVSDVGVRALAALKSAPALHSLTLYLRNV